MSRPAIQLYSLRHFDESLPGVLDRVGDAGYEGVEFADVVHDADPAAVDDALARNDLTAVSAHVSLGRLERDFEDLLPMYERVGCTDLVVPHLSTAHFRTASRVDGVADRLLALERRLDDHGFRLHYHNQPHDFLPLCGDGTLASLLTAVDPTAAGGGVGGRVRRLVGTVGDRLYERLYQERAGVDSVRETAWYRLVESTGPSVGVQVDAGSVAAAGFDPSLAVEQFADRCRTLHLTDVEVADRGPTARARSVEVGDGILDAPAVLAAAESAGVEWVVYENDDPKNPRVTLARGMETMEWESPDPVDMEPQLDG
jgi:sugar phosphate isomerase/epimerase